MPVTIQNKAEKIRFGIVGSANTALDFGILLILTSFGVPAAIANYPSSTAAVILSFFANKKYTFKATGRNLKHEIILFLIFTLIAAWALQPLTILLVQYLLSPINLPETVSVVIAKIMATVVTLIWNYITYSRYVFIKEKN
jgi:putative flippase GtrA